MRYSYNVFGWNSKVCMVNLKNESYYCTEYFLAIQFIMIKVILTLEKFKWKLYWAVRSSGVMPVQGGSNSCICRLNPEVWPLKAMKGTSLSVTFFIVSFHSTWNIKKLYTFTPLKHWERSVSTCYLQTICRFHICFFEQEWSNIERMLQCVEWRFTLHLPTSSSIRTKSVECIFISILLSRNRGSNAMKNLSVSEWCD